MKKGASHIEIVLAFILFAGAVGFALYFLNPANPEKLTSVTEDYVYREVAKNVSVGVESFSVKVKETGGVLPDVIAINFTDAKEDKNARVEDINGNELLSNKRLNLVDVNISSLDDGDFIFVKFSEDFETYGTPLLEGEEGNYYEISSSNYEEVFSEKRFLALNNSYYEDYAKLKQDFNIPDRTEFGFELVFSDLMIIRSERRIPGGLEIFSNSKRVKVLKENGEIVFADFIVKIW